MPATLPPQTEWLRANVPAAARGLVGVDRQKKAILGYVVAQRGVFKDKRGEFDDLSLRKVVELMRAEPAGLKSRFGHPTLSEDGVGKYLGRAKNPRLDGDRVRADLFFDPTAFKTPGGDLATYLMDLAESDPDALSSSLVLQSDYEAKLDAKGRAVIDPDTGEPAPQLWRPKLLHASDVVDTGDAVDGLLSAELPDAAVRLGAKLLDEQFAGLGKDDVRARCLGWLDRYLEHRFGAEPPAPAKKEEYRRRLAEQGAGLSPKGG
jgi:hypothetical protein